MRAGGRAENTVLVAHHAFVRLVVALLNVVAMALLQTASSSSCVGGRPRRGRSSSYHCIYHNRIAFTLLSHLLSLCYS